LTHVAATASAGDAADIAGTSDTFVRISLEALYITADIPRLVFTRVSTILAAETG
jgi:hypothetical protein